MRPSRHRALIATSTFALLLSACSTPTPKNQAKPSIERLQRARLIEAVVNDFKSGNQRTVSISDPATLLSVRIWIQRHAWPPIDLGATGNVIPRGYFTVFEHASDPSSAFRIYVYAATTRAEPQVVHVSQEDWQALLSLISATR